MKKIIYFLVLIPYWVFSQSNVKPINPDGKWYFGAEIGLNTITSFSYNEGKTSISIGGISEYYFNKRWSVQGKIKYIKTGVSYIDESSDWNWDWIKGSQNFVANSPYNRFDGQTIVIPIDLKWEYRIYKNLHGSIKIGPALNIELKSVYSYEVEVTDSFSSTFVNMNFGYGFNYYLSDKYCIGIDLETYSFGASKGTTSEFFWNKTYYANNALINLQLKYHF